MPPLDQSTSHPKTSLASSSTRQIKFAFQLWKMLMPLQGATKHENPTPTWPPPSKGRGAIFMRDGLTSIAKSPPDQDDLLVPQRLNLGIRTTANLVPTGRRRGVITRTCGQCTTMLIRWLAWPLVSPGGISSPLPRNSCSCFSVAGSLRHLVWRKISGTDSLR